MTGRERAQKLIIKKKEVLSILIYMQIYLFYQILIHNKIKTIPEYYKWEM
jgi:hypothetical protein